MSTTVPHDPDGPRALRGDGALADLRPALAHRPASPGARNFDEILGYHYYTELAHSAGMPADRVAAELDPETRARNLAEYLDRIDNTVQYSWLLEIARTFHGFPHDRITPGTIERPLRPRRPSQ